MCDYSLEAYQSRPAAVGEKLTLGRFASGSMGFAAGTVCDTAVCIPAESKLLLLTHAFDTLRLARVDWKTDARNQRSRQAVERLGARFEGVLRGWGPSHAPGEEGRLRDSAMFSVTAAEWPDVRKHLAARLARRAAG